jgi:hypothetical protein
MNFLAGCSHSNGVVFKNSTTLTLWAGSAKGLNNPNSISQYNTLLIDNIHSNNYKNVFFMFGGVDLDFCFYYKYLDNNQIDFREFNLKVITNYLQFISRNFFYKSVIILSVGLPCLDDEHLKIGILNGHVSQLENKDQSIYEQKLLNCELPNIYKRTEMTLHFNEKLHEEIIKLNNSKIKFLDITSFTYDDELKRIKDEFFSRNDHHSSARNSYYTKIIDDFLSAQSL